MEVLGSCLNVYHGDIAYIYCFNFYKKQPNRPTDFGLRFFINTFLEYFALVPLCMGWNIKFLNM